VPGTLWVPAIQAQDLAVNGGCLLVSLPAERSLAALAVDELARRRIPTRIATRPPPAFAARRALAGVRPGGRISDVAGRIARRLLGLGRSRGDSGQALPALLGAGLILILAALALAAIGGAATGRGRVQRAAAWRPSRRRAACGTPLLRLGSARLMDGRRTPVTSKADYLPRVAAIDAARRNRVDSGRLQPPSRTRPTLRCGRHRDGRDRSPPASPAASAPASTGPFGSSPGCRRASARSPDRDAGAGRWAAAAGPLVIATGGDAPRRGGCLHRRRRCGGRNST
jgi:hypothetical protein